MAQRTLITDPFEDDAVSMLEWLYGPEAKKWYAHYHAQGHRAGQSFMNALWEVDHASYERLTGSHVDPFHNDKNIPMALDLLTSK